MKKSYICLFLWFLLAECGQAGDIPPVAFLTNISSAPRIDGVLDDPVWSKTPEYGPLVLHATGKPALMNTSFKILRGETNLYVGIRAEENNPIVARQTLHDSDLFGEDSFEIFVSPNPSGNPYYQIIVNPLNAVYDSKGFSRTWDGTIRSGTFTGKNFWSAELEIPWEPMGVKPGDPQTAFRLNVCRNRQAGGTTEYYSWSVTPRGFHIPDRFGIVVTHLKKYFAILDAGVTGIESLVTTLPKTNVFNTPKITEIRAAVTRFSEARKKIRKGTDITPDEIGELYALNEKTLAGANEVIYDVKIQNLFR